MFKPATHLVLKASNREKNIAKQKKKHVSNAFHVGASGFLVCKIWLQNNGSGIIGSRKVRNSGIPAACLPPGLTLFSPGKGSAGLIITHPGNGGSGPRVTTWSMYYYSNTGYNSPESFYNAFTGVVELDGSTREGSWLFSALIEWVIKNFVKLN